MRPYSRISSNRRTRIQRIEHHSSGVWDDIRALSFVPPSILSTYILLGNRIRKLNLSFFLQLVKCSCYNKTYSTSIFASSSSSPRHRHPPCLEWLLQPPTLSQSNPCERILAEVYGSLHCRLLDAGSKGWKVWGLKLFRGSVCGPVPGLECRYR